MHRGHSPSSLYYSVPKPTINISPKLTSKFKISSCVNQLSAAEQTLAHIYAKQATLTCWMPKVRPETGALCSLNHFLPVHASTFAPAAPDREARTLPGPPGVRWAAWFPRPWPQGRDLQGPSARWTRPPLSFAVPCMQSIHAATASFSAGEPRARTHTHFQSPICVPGPIFSELLYL